MLTLPKALPYYLASLAAFLFGGLFQPGEWYQALTRAPWNPPNLAFPIAWTILYLMIAMAGRRAAKSTDNILIGIWWAQLLVNAAWSWLFFGQHWVLMGMIDLLLLLGLVSWFIIRSYQKSVNDAATLMIPYALWVGLACSLNGYIYLYN